MQNKVFIARTKGALKSRAELGNLDINNYVILKLNDQARQNGVLKGLVNGIEDRDYKFLMVLKDFVVLTTEGGLRVDTGKLSENDYARELNTPEEETPGDKFVVDGVVKGVLSKVSKMKGLTDEERDVVTQALKSWGGHDAEDVGGEEFVDELGETKSSHSEEEEEEDEGEEEGEEVTKATTGADGVTRPDTQPFDADPDAAKVEARIASSNTKSVDGEEEEEEVTKSVRSRISKMSRENAKEQMMSTLKSFGSISEEEPVFQNKNQAQRFAQAYNSKVSGVERAEVAGASRHVRNRYGAKAKFVVALD